MKPIFYISLIAFTIFSCKNNSKQSSLLGLRHKATHVLSNKQLHQLQANDTTEIDPENLGCLVTPYTHSSNAEQFAPGTFGKTTYVYNTMKSGGKILDTLKFNTSVNILKEYPEFYLVCTPKAKAGYIKKADLYLNKIFSSNESNYYYYLVGLTKYPPKADLELNSVTCSASALKALKIDEKSSKILLSYTDSIMGATYGVNHLFNIALKNAESVIHITYGCMHDIETDDDLFIIDNGKKISRLILGSLSGDGGYGDGSYIYLPVKLSNGKKIVLAKNGTISIDNITGKPELYPYPADCDIPIDELVVEQSWSDEPVEDGKPEYNTDGSAVETVTITATKYYRWDGNALKLIKTLNK